MTSRVSDPDILLIGSHRGRHQLSAWTEGGSVCMMKSLGAPGTLYSYGPLLTTGWTPAKLSCGGGEGMLHSSEVEFQGFEPAGLPFLTLQNRLIRKMICAAAV